MDLIQEVLLAMANLNAKYNEARADGKLSVADCYRLARAGIAEIARIVSSFPGGTAAKRDVFRTAAESFWTDVLEPIDLPMGPLKEKFVEKHLLKPMYDFSVDTALDWAFPGFAFAAASPETVKSLPYLVAWNSQRDKAA